MSEVRVAIGLRAGDQVPCGACKQLTPFRGGHYAPSSELCVECSFPVRNAESAKVLADWE